MPRKQASTGTGVVQPGRMSMPRKRLTVDYKNSPQASRTAGTAAVVHDGGILSTATTQLRGVERADGTFSVEESKRTAGMKPSSGEEAVEEQVCGSADSSDAMLAGHLITRVDQADDAQPRVLHSTTSMASEHAVGGVVRPSLATASRGEVLPEHFKVLEYSVTKINNLRDNGHNRPSPRVLRLTLAGIDNIKRTAVKSKMSLRRKSCVNDSSVPVDRVTKSHSYTDIAAVYVFMHRRISQALGRLWPEAHPPTAHFTHFGVRSWLPNSHITWAGI